MTTTESQAAALFADKSEVRIRGLLVGERIDLRALETTQRLAMAPTVIAAGDRGCAALFRYGAVVLFNLSPVEEASFLTNLRPLISGQFAQLEIEDAVLKIDPQAKEERAANGVVVVAAPSLDRVQIVADIFAKSVALAYYERSVAAAFDRIEPLAENLEHFGTFKSEGKDLLKHLGGTLQVQQKMVGRVEVTEKPEILWDRPELDRLFQRLLDEYELPERHAALGRKLDLISSTAQTILNLLQQRHSLRVEWYVVILIVVEIILTIIEMFRQR